VGDLNHRLFFGVELDNEVRHGLAASIRVMGRPLPGKPVPPQNWHLTLRFLGAASTVQRDVVLGRLAERLRERRFPVRFGILGAFPRPNKASVLFLAVDDGVDAMRRLATVCEEAAIDAGFEPEERPFHPHITLARIRPPQNVEAVIHEFGVLGLGQVVSDVALFASHLEPGGARYEVIDGVPLLRKAQ